MHRFHSCIFCAFSAAKHFQFNNLSGSRNVWVCYSNSRRWSILVYLPSFLECLHQIKADRIQCDGTLVVAKGGKLSSKRLASYSFLSHSLLNLNLYVAGPFRVDRGNGEIAGIVSPNDGRLSILTGSSQ